MIMGVPLQPLQSLESQRITLMCGKQHCFDEIHADQLFVVSFCKSRSMSRISNHTALDIKRSAKFNSGSLTDVTQNLLFRKSRINENIQFGVTDVCREHTPRTICLVEELLDGFELILEISAVLSMGFRGHA